MGTSPFSGLSFAEQLKFDPQGAFEYRLKTLGEPIPEFFGTVALDTSLNETLTTPAPIDPIPSTETSSEDTQTLNEVLQNTDVNSDVPGTNSADASQTPQETQNNTSSDPVVNANTVGTEENPILSTDSTSSAPVETTIPPATEEKKEYTIEDLRKLLKDKEIAFFGGASIEKLMELCIQNNLV